MGLLSSVDTRWVFLFTPVLQAHLRTRLCHVSVQQNIIIDVCVNTGIFLFKVNRVGNDGAREQPVRTTCNACTARAVCATCNACCYVYCVHSAIHRGHTKLTTASAQAVVVSKYQRYFLNQIVVCR